MWAFAMALNASMPRFEGELSVSLGDYSYGHPNMTSIIRHELSNVEFEGTRGIVDFSSETFDGENVTATQFATVACFNPTEDSSITVAGNHSAIIPHSFDQSIIIAPPVYVETVVLIVALTACHTSWYQCEVDRCEANKSYESNLIFFGCYIYLISILFLSFKGTTGSSNPVALTAKCSDFIWCETIGFSLIFGTICVKS